MPRASRWDFGPYILVWLGVLFCLLGGVLVGLGGVLGEF